MSATPFVAANTSSQKLRSFAQKFVKDPPKDKEGNAIPAPKNDIFERMDLGHKLSQDNSIDDTIDAFPDTRYPVKYIIYNVMKLYKTLDQERPLLTPSSFVAYCLFQLYAFALINDVYGRPHPSFPANQFMDADSRNDLLDAFCNSYVAPFMITLFHALSNTSDPRRPGLQYFCTLAGSRFKTDFGRYLPPHIFLVAHNMSTEADTSRNVAAAMAALINTTLFTDNTEHLDIRVANYLSCGITDTTFYDSWLYEAVKTLFSPVTGKSLLRRSNIESVSLDPQFVSFNQSANTTEDNQYVLFLAADRDNIYSTLDFVSSFSNLVDSAFPTAVKLGSIPDSQHGTTILVHGYSTIALPTWHSRQFKSDTELKLTTKLRTSKYAEDTHFLQVTKYTKGATIEYPDDSKKNFPKGFLLFSDKAHKAKDDPDSEITFDPELHEFPRVLFLDPYTSGDGPVSLSMLAGLIIESYEVDGSSVPMPDPSIGLSVNNRQFLQGSLPLRYIHHGYTGTVYHDIAVLPRSVVKSRVQKISHDLYDMSKNRLGQIDLDVSQAQVTGNPPGFDLVEHIGSLFRMFNRLALTSTSVPTAAPKTVNTWSPYRFVSSRKEEQPQDGTTFMIFNHRALYGTHIPLVSTRHPATVIPLS